MNDKIGTLFLGVVIGAAIVIASGLGTAYMMLRPLQQPQPNAPAPSADSPGAPAAPSEQVQDTTQTAPPPLEGSLITDPGVTWLPEPEKITKDLKLFQQSADAEERVTYYKTGSDNGRDIIIADIPPEGPGTSYHAYLVDLGGGGYEILAKHSENYDPGSSANQGGVVFYGAELNPAVSVNYIKTYRSIEEQKTISYKGVLLTISWRYEESESPLQRTEVAKTPYGVLYSVTGPASLPTLSVHTFVLRRPNGIDVAYQYNPPDVLLDDGVADVVWSTGEKNTTPYQVISTSGCGGGGFFTPILNESELPRTKEIGRLSSGSPVLGFATPNHAVLSSLYEETGGTYYDEKGGAQKLSFSMFTAKHPVMIVKDDLGRYLVYNNTKYGPAVECGKPVIYLYPEQPTTVSVNVDAAIRISDPLYENGWTVRALPNGTLYHKGKMYNSLFWEGFGKDYPRITRGAVVAQSELEQTLHKNLKELGLNKKESADFLEFWLPRMPKDPFVRLSWLTTREMDALAPLSVTPKPDTVIRIFLDFEGLAERKTLPPQHLSTIPREGFTVIEWGGLLRR